MTKLCVFWEKLFTSYGVEQVSCLWWLDPPNLAPVVPATQPLNYALKWVYLIFNNLFPCIWSWVNHYILFIAKNLNLNLEKPFFGEALTSPIWKFSDLTKVFFLKPSLVIARNIYVTSGQEMKLSCALWKNHLWHMHIKKTT